MKSFSKQSLLLVCTLITSSYFHGCGSSSSTTISSDGGADSGSTLTGTIDSFTSTLVVENKSLVSNTTITVGTATVTTGSDGTFTLTNIDTGDQTITFTQGSSSATYSLDDVDASETHTLSDVSIADTTVSTAHTGVWTGTITMSDGDDDVDYEMTLTISAGGNALSGTMTVAVDEGESGTFSGTENGSTIEATYTLTGTNCTLSGPLTGTFSGNTLAGNAPITEDSCGLEPGDEDEDSHPFTLTQS